MKFKMIPKKDIELSEWNPRKKWDIEKSKQLKKSIESIGMINPVRIRPNRKKKNKYLVTAGSTRWMQSNDDADIPCLIKDESEFDAMIASLTENYMREDVSDADNEKFIAEIYYDGVKQKRWDSATKMSNATGIPQETISSILQAYADRKGLGGHLNVSTADMHESRPLKDKPEIRKQLLQKRAAGEIKRSGHVMHDMSKTLAKVPEQVAKAVLDDKIDWDQAETVASTMEETGTKISKEEEHNLVRHLEQEKKMLDVTRELSKKTSAETVKGKPEKHLTFDKTVDENRLERWKKLCETFRYMTKADINIIDDEKLRAKAVAYLKRIRDDCSRVLRDLGEESVIDVE